MSSLNAKMVTKSKTADVPYSNHKKSNQIITCEIHIRASKYSRLTSEHSNPRLKEKSNKIFSIEHLQSSKSNQVTRDSRVAHQDLVEKEDDSLPPCLLPRFLITAESLLATRCASPFHFFLCRFRCWFSTSFSNSWSGLNSAIF